MVIVMARLIKCSDCGKKISVNANACPNCGAPAQQSVDNDRRISGNRKTALGYVLGAFFIVSGLGAFTTGFLPAILLIAGGVLALPVARRALIARNFSNSHTPFVIASAILIIFGTIMLNSKKQESHLKYIEENPEAYAAEQAEIAKRDAEKQEQENQLEYVAENKSVSDAELDVNSTNYQMNYMECVQKQNSIKEDVLSSGNYNVIPITKTETLSVIRICTNDGSVLVTCNAVDQNIITTQSNNREGC